MGIDSRSGDIPFSSLNFRRSDFFDKTTHQERKSSLTPEIQSILNYRDETNPSITLQELAALEPTETKPRTLFTDKPSLYDQYHQQYSDEIQTIEGSQKRQQDISILAQRNIDNPDLVYDQLRSRGISARDIVSMGRSASAYFNEELVVTIDRLYSLNLFKPDRFSQEFLLENKYLGSFPDDETFLTIRNQLQPFTFLKGFDLTKQFFLYYDRSLGKFPPKTINLLQSIQDSYFKNPKDESKLHQHVFREYSEYKYGNYNFGKESSFLTFIFDDRQDSSKSGIIKLIQTIINADVQSGQKITIPQQIRQLISPKEQKIFDVFSELSSRYEQNFLSKTIDSSDIDYNQSKINEFFTNGRLNKEFYYGMIESSEESDPKIVVPDYLVTPDLSSDYFSDSDENFLKIVNDLPTLSHQKIFKHLKDASYSDFSYFFTDGKLNFNFYKLALSQSDRFSTSFIKSENLDHLPLNEKNSILAAFKFISETKNSDSRIRNFILENLDKTSLFLNQNQQLTSFLFEQLIKNERLNPDFLTKNLTSKVISTFSPEDQKIWKNVLSLINKKNEDILPLINFIFSHKDQFELFFDDNNQLTEYLFNSAFSSGSRGMLSSLLFKLQPEVLASFSPDNQKLWRKIQEIYTTNSSYDKNDLIIFLFHNKESFNDYFDSENKFTQKFYIEYAKNFPENIIKYYNRQTLSLIFGQDIIFRLLDSLPKSTDEKRNAFTHNEYDRTSKFFEYLIHNQTSEFKLDKEYLQIATEYIKKFGLAKSVLFYRYFQTLYFYERGEIPNLPKEFTENHISSIEDLENEVKKIQKICFGSDSMTDLSKLTPFQIESISVATNHSVGRWTVIPINTIISDFSRDFSQGKIKALPSEFHPETIKTNPIKIETDKKISDSQNLSVLRKEILQAITEGNDISSEKRVLIEVFSQRMSQLSGNTGDNSKKQEYIQKQIAAFTQAIDSISSSNSVDMLLSKLIPFTFGLGVDQEKYNSLLRQLVFKKVFDKHQNSPGWQENIKNSLEGNDTPSAVSKMTDLINNTIKDHVLNFETKNQEHYWDDSTFEIVKKYSGPFKKNLSFQTYINELNAYRESFIVTQLDKESTTSLIPDRGLIGEMSGYMAGVCYTKVYPLLKTYPDMIPYKFITNSQSDNQEFIGSTLVFQVKGTKGQPFFLIRAFDIPDEQSIDVSLFFESFIDHLVPIAKKMGIKKIITAGTPGTISNYSITTDYVTSKYVRDKKPVPLKKTFDFNGYDITKQCYLVRDIS